MVIKAIHNAVCAGPVYPLTESTVRKFKSQKNYLLNLNSY